jgi:hypothetical protein
MCKKASIDFVQCFTGITKFPFFCETLVSKSSQLPIVSAKQCCKGDGSFQSERAIFEGPPTENPLTDRYQILNQSLPS